MRKKSRKIHVIDNALIVLFALLMLIAAVPLACTEVHAANNDAVEISQEDCVLTITKDDMRQENIGGSTVLFYDFYMAGYEGDKNHFYSWINNGDAVTVSNSYPYYPSYTRQQLFDQYSSLYTSNLAAGAANNNNRFNGYPKYNWDGNQYIKDENCTGYYFFVQAPQNTQNVNLTFIHHEFTEFHAKSAETGLYEFGEICSKCGEKKDVISIHKIDRTPGEHTIKAEDLELAYGDQLYYIFAIDPTRDIDVAFNKSDGFNGLNVDIGSGYNEDISIDELWDIFGNEKNIRGEEDKTSYECELSGGRSYLISINRDLRYGSSFGEDLIIHITNAPERLTSQDGLWQYYIKNDQAYLCKWLGKGDTITYPRTIDGYTVRQVRGKGTYTEEQMNAIKHVIFEMGTIETAENDDYLEPADPTYYRSTHFDNFPYDVIEDVTLHSQGYIDSHDGSYYNINYYNSSKIICACDYDVLIDKPATCTEWGHVKKVCKTCGDVYDKDTDRPTYTHNYTIPLKELPPCVSDFVEYKCETCDRTLEQYQSASVSHNWNPIEPVFSCCSDSYMCECDICGNTSQQWISSTTDHDYEVIEDVPTACERGYQTKKCKICGEKRTWNDYSNNPTGHNYENKGYFPASCSYGYTLMVCTNCGESYRETDWDAPPIYDEHDYQLVDRHEPEDCTHPGWEEYECSVCGDKGRNLQTVDHAWEVIFEKKGINCRNQGTVIKECSICGERVKEKPYGDHVFVPDEDVSDMVCEEVRYCYHRCEICGFRPDMKFKYSVDHDYSILIERKDPTCFDVGYDKCECAKCGKIDRMNYTPYLGNSVGHDFVFTDRGYGQLYSCTNCDEAPAIFVNINNDETTWLDISEYEDEILSDLQEGVTNVYLIYNAKYNTQVIQCKDQESGEVSQLGAYYNGINSYRDLPNYVSDGIECISGHDTKKGNTYISKVTNLSDNISYKTYHEHEADIATIVEVDPSCTADGYKEWDCAHCGEHNHEDKIGTAVGGGNGHIWGPWKTVKAATVEATGKQERTCSVCSEKESKTIPKLDPPQDPGTGSETGTNTSPQPSNGTTKVESGTVVAVKPAKEDTAATKTNVVTKAKTVVKAPDFGTLRLLSKKQTEKAIKLEWTKVPGATKYTIYGTPCGSGNKAVKIASVKGNAYTVKKINKKALKKGTYYNCKVVAEKDGKTVGISKQIHVSTLGNKKKGNYSSVSVSNAVVKKAKSLKKGKTLSLKASAKPIKGYKVKNHEGLRYESTNPKIATVSSSGKVKGIKKGTCYIYVYAQNGVFKKIKVTVK